MKAQIEEALGLMKDLGNITDGSVESVDRLRLVLLALVEVLGDVGEGAFHTQKAFRDMTLTAKESGSFIATFTAGMQVAVAQLVDGIAKGLGQLLADVVSGQDDVLARFGQFIGSLLIQTGSAMMAMATASLFGSLIPFLSPLFNPAAAAGMLAAGAAMVALGAAMGGNGPRSAGARGGGGGGGAAETPTFAFNQALIDVNQGIAQAAGAMNSAAGAVTAGMGGLVTAPAGVVVRVGNNQMGGVLTQVSKEARRGKHLKNNINLAKALRGR